MTAQSSTKRHDTQLDEIFELAQPLGAAADLDPLIERVGDARFVLLGEASHGTSEFYRWRATITRRLIVERGFSFVAVEGDWPDCFDLNCWIKGQGNKDLSAAEVLSRFDRWPTWMWANREVAEFAQWLRLYNKRSGSEVGFYGLDVYSLWESLDRVIGYLHEHQPDAVNGALAAFRCFEPYGGDPQQYATASQILPTSCEGEVISVLSDLRARFRRDSSPSESDFDALQNAEVLAGAERYYRTMVRGDAESWNIRDCHMVDTLDRLMKQHGLAAKAVVWEHNTHVGDARATDMSAAGMVNVGQVVRERHDADGVVLVGFGCYQGSVIAAPQWGAPFQKMPVPRAPASSHEALIHAVTKDPALFVFPERRDTPWLTARRGHRAIGVVYHPDRDPYGNWVPTVLGRRYDAFISFGRADAVHPLHDEAPRPNAEQETYPFNA
jgi:erythromycin esterase